MAWLPKNPGANTFALLEQGRERVAERGCREVSLLQKKVDGFSKWSLAAIDVTCISKLLCDFYSPKVAALKNRATNEVVWLWLPFRAELVNIPANGCLAV